MSNRSNYSKQSKMQRWTVTRMVRERYDVMAHNRETAKLIVAERGNPFEVTVISETATKLSTMNHTNNSPDLFTKEQCDYVDSISDGDLRSHLLHQVRLRDNMERDRDKFEKLLNDQKDRSYSKEDCVLFLEWQIAQIENGSLNLIKDKENNSRMWFYNTGKLPLLRISTERLFGFYLSSRVFSETYPDKTVKP